MSNSATGGFLKPTFTESLPGNLTLEQFIQTILVGLTGLNGTLIRPKWQKAPPKSPDVDISWISFGVNIIAPDANAFVGMDADDNTIYQRQEGVEVEAQFYGPSALQNASLIRDGFQVQQNLEELTKANMGFVEVSPAQHIPDLVNERFVNRYIMTIYLRRQINRKYAVLPVLSSQGTIRTQVDGENYDIDFETQEEN